MDNPQTLKSPIHKSDYTPRIGSAPLVTSSEELKGNKYDNIYYWEILEPQTWGNHKLIHNGVCQAKDWVQAKRNATIHSKTKWKGKKWLPLGNAFEKYKCDGRTYATNGEQQIVRLYKLDKNGEKIR